MLHSPFLPQYFRRIFGSLRVHERILSEQGAGTGTYVWQCHFQFVYDLHVDRRSAHQPISVAGCRDRFIYNQWLAVTIADPLDSRTGLLVSNAQTARESQVPHVRRSHGGLSPCAAINVREEYRRIWI